MRIGRRIVKILFWGLLLSFSIAGGALWFAYWYMTDSETAARLIREHAVKFFPGSSLEPGRVRIRPILGEIVLNQLQLLQRIDGTPFEVLRIPWLNIRINTRKLAKGELEAKEVVVSHPILRLRRRRDGKWNLDGLLADPWPGPWINTPPIYIQNATLELIPDDDTPKSQGLNTSESDLSQNPPTPLANAKRSSAILRDVMLKVEGNGGGPENIKFEGSARGDVFDKLLLEGTVNLVTGAITLKGDLARMTLSETLRRRIPREAVPTVNKLALNGGMVDIELKRFRYDPSAAPGARLSYHALARLREGVCECSKLPFPVNDLSAWISVEDGTVSIKEAQGSNGPTTLRVEGTMGIGDPSRAPLNMRVDLVDLELDQRLRKRTPAEYEDLWDVFKPRGRVSAELRVIRRQTDEPVDLSATVFCRDVAAVYRFFPYPLEHLAGQLTLEKKTLALDLHTVGGQPMRLAGTIQNPGVDAVVKLDIQAEGVQIDETLKNAMPADVLKVVKQFNPQGIVKAHATVFRKPLPLEHDRPEGHIAIDAEIDLTDRCEITWDRLPYTIRDLKGRLEVHPDLWVFKNMEGSHGQAKIRASGSVQKLPQPKLANGDDPLKIAVSLEAENLPFGLELKDALPLAWKKSWPTINPSGASDVVATVHVAPDEVDHTHAVNHTHVEIVPRPESNARLEVTRSPQPGIDPGGLIELPMEDIHGRFVFDDGRVTMHDVNFKFRGAPVKFSKGNVFLEDSGQFDLSVQELWVDEIRFDLDLRKKMPKLMGQFALRLDDGRTFRARGDLQIGWSGVECEPAWCKWKNTLVVFMDNSVRTGIPLEHIQGQLDQVIGWSNGATLEVQGVLRLDSVSMLGQQITMVESPFQINQGLARLINVRGHFLKGEIVGDDCWITLDATPHYHTNLSIRGAQLQEYARTISGRQSYRGNVDVKIELNGSGNDVRFLYGGGEAHITEGDLGELGPVLRFATALNRVSNNLFSPPNRPRTAGKTAFDSADVAFTIAHGHTTFDPIKFTGNAFSLLGRGTMNPQGNLDLRLSVLWGRDRLHIPLVSDFTREASTPLVIAHVVGTPSNPQFDIKPLPLLDELFKAVGRGRAERQSP
jgi:hypothetical protein